MMRALFLIFTVVSVTSAQLPVRFRLSHNQVLAKTTSDRPAGNVIVDLIHHKKRLFAATEEGLCVLPDSSGIWTTYEHEKELGRGGISALTAKDSNVYLFTLYTTEYSGEDIPTGSGISVSTDLGATWIRYPQPTDRLGDDEEYIRRWDSVANMIVIDTIKALEVIVPQQNVTYDMAVNDSGIWITSWAGGLRHSRDTGKTFRRVLLPPDKSFEFNPDEDNNHAFTLNPRDPEQGGNHNHKGFSVVSSKDSRVLWVGTAAGANLSTDGGSRWRRFTAYNDGLTGDWVTALGLQEFTNRFGEQEQILWAATLPAVNPNDYTGVSVTRDQGKTWSTIPVLKGIRAYNFSFYAGLVFISTERGLYYSSDQQNFVLLDNFEQRDANGKLIDRAFASAVYAHASDTIGHHWIGTEDGLVELLENGKKTKLYRAYAPPGAKTYAFPNPFHPSRYTGICRIVFAGDGGESTLRIYDFSMDLVIEQHESFPAGEHFFVWDGRNGRRRQVANGTYFYKVDSPGKSTRWGKIMVID